MNRTSQALKNHAEQTHSDARAVQSHINQILEWPHWPTNLEAIHAPDIKGFITHCERLHLSPSTIGTRLSVLKQAMARAGVAWPFGVKMPPRSKRPKWVLTPQNQADLCNWLIQQGTAPGKTMLDYIVFVTETGLRVEEAQRVTAKHILMINGEYFLEVIGTKTAASYDIIPLSKAAIEVIVRRALVMGEASPIFQFRYDHLNGLWAECINFLGVTDETATLKSLRRTFASRMAAKGCPAPILQKLMRHGSLATTSHYTNTIGMHEAARQWVA